MADHNRPISALAIGAFALPSDAASSRAIILLRLRKRDELLTISIFAKLLGGAVISFLIPAIPAFFIALETTSASFWETFRNVCLFLVPVSFALAWWWSDDELLQQVQYLGQMYGPLSRDMPFTQTSWDIEMQGRGGELLFAIGFLILGPRLVWSALQQCRTRFKLCPVDLDRAVDLLLTLLATDHGLPFDELRRQHDDGQKLAKVLAFLRLHDWIDVGAKSNHAWLLVSSRELLLKDLTAHTLTQR